MSKETLAWLNTQVLFGFTEKRGRKAWHYDAELQEELQVEDNQYPHEIPIADVRRRIFNWEAVEGKITGTHEYEPEITDTGVIVRPPLIGTDSERKVIMRGDTGTILGVFKSGYRIHQFDEWLTENVETILDSDLKIGSAGLLKGGAVGWVQVELEETLAVEANGTDVHFRPRLTAATSLDGSLATSYTRGVQVVECDNTLSCALMEHDQQIKIRHSRNSLNRIQEVRDALGIVWTIADEFEDQVKALSHQKVSDEQWATFTKAYAEPAKKSDSQRSKTMVESKIADLNRLWNYDERVTPWKGNAFGVVQAVNTYTHWVGTVKNMGREERNADRAITGGADKLDQGTYALLQKVLAH